MSFHLAITASLFLFLIAFKILLAATEEVNPFWCPLSSLPYGAPLDVNAFLPTSVATLPGAINVTCTL